MMNFYKIQRRFVKLSQCPNIPHYFPKGCFLGWKIYKKNKKITKKKNTWPAQKISFLSLALKVNMNPCWSPPSWDNYSTTLIVLEIAKRYQKVNEGERLHFTQLAIHTCFILSLIELYRLAFSFHNSPFFFFFFLKKQKTFF